MNPVLLEPTASNLAATEIALKVEKARAAYHIWSKIPLLERIRILREFWSFVESRRDAIGQVLHAETGKPMAEVMATELDSAAMIVKYFTRNGYRLLKDQPVPHPWVMFNKRTYVRYVPRGLVGLITPWNFPFMIPMGDATPALIAGNAVLLKPSEWTPRTALHLEHLFDESGLFPEGLFQVLTGDGKVGQALIDNVDMVLFTGSSRTGRAVAQAAAARLIPAVLELGGKHPMVVFKDAALDRAAKGAAWGRFANCGQACVGVERIFVERDVYAPFLAKLTEEVRALRQGVDDHYDIDLGRLIYPRQLEVIERHLADARAKGARIIGEGIVDREKLLVAPTIVADATKDMLCMQEETFGPILPVMQVDHPEEAVAFSNNGPYGLAGSLWTKDIARAERLSRDMQVGLVGINDLMSHYVVCSLPFGGMKESGVGRRHGEEGLRMFCQPQSVLVHEFPANQPELWWFPYSKFRTKVVSLFSRLS